MAARNPRKPSGPPGLTRTQQLRQAKSAAIVKEFEQKEIAKQAAPRGGGAACPGMSRRVAPQRREPKKVDFGKPGMTKAMLARMKQAEKFKEEYERKKQAEMPATRRPRRTPAPIGGDARVGKERGARRTGTAVATASRAATRRSPQGPPPIPERTKELARSIDAEIVQAEPISEGPIDNIVIPPGVVSENRTVVVNIPQPASPASSHESSRLQASNRSLQMISEALDEQDAVESAAVQGKLTELQLARRDFVIAAANVGNNSFNLADETPPFFPGSPPPLSPSPRRLLRVPEISDEMFQIEFGREHPDIVAAREFAQRSKAIMMEKEAARRMEDELERLARQTVDEFRPDYEDELYQEGDVSWEDDDDLMVTRIPRVRAEIQPARQEPYMFRPFIAEELERFFDVERFPPSPPRAPQIPPGREHLHPDLWELDDPWFKLPPPPDVPDLIDFGD